MIKLLNNTIIRLLAYLIVAILISVWTTEKHLEIVLDKIFFNTLSILVGLSIAIVGIFLGSINSLYLSLYKMVKKDDSKFSKKEIKIIKTGLNSIVQELRENTMLTIYCLVAALALYIFKTIDIPLIYWFVESKFLSKNLFINICIIFISILIIASIIDSTKVIFKITKAFEIVKDK